MDGSIYSGIGVSAGIVIGTALLVGDDVFSVKERAINKADVKKEIKRFHTALQVSSEQLEILKKQVAEVIGEKDAAIFDSHLLLIVDPAIVKQVEDGVRDRLCNVEIVFREIIDHYCQLLEAVDDSYIRDRLSDIRDVANRVIRNLQGGGTIDLSCLQEPRVIVSTDLSPSDTASMDRTNVSGFITSIGSRTSHTAIMARSMGIPAVVGASGITDKVKSGDAIIVDGIRGKIIVRPTETQLGEYQKRIQEQTLWFKQVEEEIALPAETKDGYRVQLAANIELPEDLPLVKKAHGVGIGLFRTEFLFLKGDKLPDEEEQFKVYRKVAEDIYPRSVIFRTLDIGGDKFVSHMPTNTELNPFLGMRAIRFCLSQPKLFKSQLRAILRASAFGKTRIMFPMISTLEELTAALEHLEDAKQELKENGIPYNQHLDVGTMIEVPAAAMLANQLAPHIDFFSIGTNDLIQYSLAADRANPDISYLYQPSHPAIIHLLKGVVDAAYAHGKWVGICGEMASEPMLVPIVLGLGIHELSMSPVAIGAIKKLIRQMRMYEAEELVEQALQCSTAREVWKLCEEFVQRVAPELLPE